MHIVYDARFFPVNDKFDGVGRYSYELARALAEHRQHTFTWLVSDKRQIEKLPEGNHLLVSRPDDIFHELTLPRQLNTLGADIVYSPFYLMGAGLGKRNYKLVLTIHDMIYFKYRTPPQWLPWHERVAWWLFNSAKWPTKLLLRSASAIATVSETVKTELDVARMTRQPITAVFNAPAKVPGQSNATNHSISGNLLYMGAFTPYKNVELLIDTMAALPDCTLHLLSRIPPRRRQELENLAQTRGVGPHVVFHDGVSDEIYRQLLDTARCLVSASKIEGFGLPILEAQARGVPVACSDIPIFREVAGDAAVFFDPNSPTDCATALRSLSNKKISDQLIKKGYHNATRYTWEKSAQNAYEICKNI